MFVVIDPILPLAFSMHSGKGIYALLLGSGISRAAGIPTGWEVTEDLIKKLAATLGETSTAEADPEDWYKQRFGEEPDYSRAVNHLAAKPAERQKLLEDYFEPDEADREEGRKLPTEAHLAIARLAASGYVRVLITTNFDRLLERALETVGVTPTVISTPGTAGRALPVQHTRCTVIKVHGDYLDPWIKNTSAELAEYDPRMNALLDKVFDEYGLVICGWSGEYDTALRGALERSRSHRFMTYWAARNEPGETARRIIEFTSGQVVKIESADEFFRELTEKVEALEEYSSPHPLSAPLAVATLKKRLEGSEGKSHKIRLHDLVMREAEFLRRQVSPEEFPLDGVQPSPKGIETRVERYETLSEIAINLMAAGCFWGQEPEKYLWVKCLELIANPSEQWGGYNAWLELKLYPALLLLYAGGVASVAAGRYDTLAALLKGPTIMRLEEETPLAFSLVELSLGPLQSRLNALPGMARLYAPLSERIFEVLREPLREALPRDTSYAQSFDRFEYLLALVHVELRLKDDPDRRVWAPFGRFGYRNRRYPEKTIMKEIDEEFEREGSDWPPLKTGLIDASTEEFRMLKDAFDLRVEELPWY